MKPLKAVRSCLPSVWLLAFTTIVLLNCGGRKDSKSDRSEELLDNNVLISTNAAGTSSSSAEFSINLVGQSSHLLDARALKDALNPVFGAVTRSAPAGSFFATNPNEYFTPAEGLALGTYTLENSSKERQFLENLKSPNLSYLRALRGFLVDACTVLVNREYPIVGTQQGSRNVLVRSKLASPEEISKFMDLMFSFPSDKLHRGATEYAALFQKQKEAQLKVQGSVEANVVKNLYVLMCVAIGSDSRTILR